MSSLTPRRKFPSLRFQKGPASWSQSPPTQRESAANGLAEKSVGVLGDILRTTLLAFRVNTETAFTVDHPIVDWAVQLRAPVGT